MGASGDRLERFLLVLAGASLVATVIFARQGLALIRTARNPEMRSPGDMPLDDQAVAIVASWDDFTLE